MRRHVSTSFLASLAAVTISCASEKAVGPEVQSPRSETSTPAITGVLVTASAYTTLIGSTAQTTAVVSTQGTVSYNLEWSLTGVSNTATIDSKTGMLTAAAPGFAYPRACASYTMTDGQPKTVCAETSVRIVASIAPAENVKLAFVRNGSIFVSAPGASEATLLIPDAGRPSWSPDGTRIAFARPIANVLARWQLCIANQVGSDTRCATGPADGRVVSKPSWSPDGSRLVFSVFTQECHNNVCGPDDFKFTLWFLNTATMQIESAKTPQVTSASWSPDGRKIAMTLFGVGTFGRGALATVNPDGSELNILSLALGSYSMREPAWSPDGSRLALVLEDEAACPWYCDSAIGVVNADGTQLKVLDRAHTCFGSSCNGNESYIWGAPEWTPDGERVAYTLTRGGECFTDELITCGTDIRTAQVNGNGIEVLMAAAGFPSRRQ